MTDEGSATRESRKACGGIIPGTAAQPAFTLALREPAPVPILIAVPHAGRAYPAALAALMRNQAAASLRLEDRFADLVAEAVANETGAALLIANADRKSTRLNSSHLVISYAVFCLKQKIKLTRLLILLCLKKLV